MTFLEAFKKVYMEEIFTISGRASRKEYWGGQLVFLLGGLLYILIVPTTSLDVILTTWFYIGTWTSGIRRMHDVGKSGWFLLIPFYNLILSLSESQQFDNKWGSPSSHTIETQNNEDSEKIEDE